MGPIGDQNLKNRVLCYSIHPILGISKFDPFPYCKLKTRDDKIHTNDQLISKNGVDHTCIAKLIVVNQNENRTALIGFLFTGVVNRHTFHWGAPNPMKAQ